MEIVKLSQRLLAVESMITNGNVVADIGTDHGYLPIHLIQSGKTRHVIAMDVRKGPLGKASANISEYEVSHNIELRLSNGLDELECGEVHTVTICGMGGKLIARILEAGKSKLGQDSELILSPQSELFQFREYLANNGYITLMEDMILEGGKYYVIIKCKLTKCDTNQESSTLYLKYGRYLLEHRNQTLKQYILKEQKKIQRVKKTVLEAPTDGAMRRIEELDKELQRIEEGLKYYEM